MKISIKILCFVATAFMFTSCGAFANMTPDEAFDIGWGIGTAARILIDN